MKPKLMTEDVLTLLHTSKEDEDYLDGKLVQVVKRSKIRAIIESLKDDFTAFEGDAKLMQYSVDDILEKIDNRLSPDILGGEG